MKGYKEIHLFLKGLDVFIQSHTSPAKVIQHNSSWVNIISPLYYISGWLLLGSRIISLSSVTTDTREYKNLGFLCPTKPAEAWLLYYQQIRWNLKISPRNISPIEGN